MHLATCLRHPPEEQSAGSASMVWRGFTLGPLPKGHTRWCADARVVCRHFRCRVRLAAQEARRGSRPGKFNVQRETQVDRWWSCCLGPSTACRCFSGERSQGGDIDSVRVANSPAEWEKPCSWLASDTAHWRRTTSTHRLPQAAAGSCQVTKPHKEIFKALRRPAPHERSRDRSRERSRERERLERLLLLCLWPLLLLCLRVFSLRSFLLCLSFLLRFRFGCGRQVWFQKRR